MYKLSRSVFATAKIILAKKLNAYHEFFSHKFKDFYFKITTSCLVINQVAKFSYQMNLLIA